MKEFMLESGNVTVLTEATDAEIKARRQQQRNVFTERCRLMHVPTPAIDTLNRWWPGTVEKMRAFA